MMSDKHGILLMEDDEVLRKYLAKLLRADEFDVLEVGSVKEAMINAQSPNIHVIVADLKMPDDTAIGLIKKMNEIQVQVPIIIITAFGEWETYLEALDLGVCDYLNKPIEYTELKEKITAVLSKRARKRVRGKS